MKFKRIVDLSHTIMPGEEEYTMEVDTRFTEGWPQFAKYTRQPGTWYILSEVHMSTHVGTHIEFPYHHVEQGLDAAQYPLKNLIGEACVVDISAWGNNERIDLPGLKQRAKGVLHPGDIAMFYTGFDRYYRTPNQHHRPWFEPECISWLADEMQIQVMGVDTSGIEVRTPDGGPTGSQPNHEKLLGAGIALLEYLAHLDEFLNQRFTAFVLPIKVARLEAFPVRVVGIQFLEEK